MKHIWSRSAPTTTLKVDGPPLTVRSCEPTSEDLEVVTTMLGKMYPDKTVINGTNAFDFWWWRFTTWASIKHKVGLHTAVACREYDEASGRVIDDGFVCFICDKKVGR